MNGSLTADCPRLTAKGSYSYVNNNPLSFLDPTGFDEEDLLDEIVVEAAPIVEDAGSFIGSLFGLGGGGGSKLSANQQNAQRHGINLSSTLPSIASINSSAIINDSGIQSAAAGYFGADSNQFELTGVGSAPAGAAIDGVPQIDGLTVYGHIFYGTNLALLFVGIGAYNPLHAGVQTLQVGINGALGIRGVMNLYGLARGAFSAGALSPEIAATFTNGEYSATTLTEDMTAYRYSGGISGAVGRFLTVGDTVAQISSPTAASIALNLPLGATAETLNVFTIPAGTTIFTGGVAGGADTATQIFIQNASVLIPQ